MRDDRGDYYREHELRDYVERLRLSPAPKLWAISDHILELMDDVGGADSKVDQIEKSLQNYDAYPLDDDGNAIDEGTADSVDKLAGIVCELREIFSPSDDDKRIGSIEIDILHPKGPAELRAFFTRAVELERFRHDIIDTIVKFGAMAPPPPSDGPPDADGMRRAEATALTMLKLLLP